MMIWSTLDDKTVCVCWFNHEERQNKQIESVEKMTKKWQWMKRNLRDNDIFEDEIHYMMKEHQCIVEECEDDEIC